MTDRPHKQYKLRLPSLRYLRGLYELSQKHKKVTATMMCDYLAYSATGKTMDIRSNLIKRGLLINNRVAHQQCFIEITPLGEKVASSFPQSTSNYYDAAKTKPFRFNAPSPERYNGRQYKDVPASVLMRENKYDPLRPISRQLVHSALGGMNSLLEDL